MRAREEPTTRPEEIDAFFASAQGQHDLRAHLTKRTDTDRTNIVPWIDRYLDLARAEVLEIGCGTGASTVALAEQGARVVGIDPAEHAVDVARTRCALLDLDVVLHEGNGVDIQSSFADRQFDLIAFSASLEHMTFEERLASLRAAWDLLPARGLLCIVEAPNRLACFDDHTSLLPFFHWLPDDLALRYARFSERRDFGEHYRELDESSMFRFLRQGRSVSFHEFQLALDHDLSVLSCLWQHGRTGRRRGRRWRRTVEGRHTSLMRKLRPDLPPAWFFPYLDLLLEKPPGP